MFASLLRPTSRRTPPPSPPDEIAGIRVRPNPRARRLSLRVDHRSGDVVLVWPKRASVKAAERFIAEQQEWIAQQRANMIPPETFQPGQTLDIAGNTLTLSAAGGRGVTRIENGHVIVHGRPEFFHRRLRDFLKAMALAELARRTHEKTALLGLKPAEVRIADPKSRWGSCGSDGRIMYSWRLILAPEHVIDYIVAHECAHRVHMNHGRHFWRLCLSLCKSGGAARRWLKTDGQKLMRYS